MERFRPRSVSRMNVKGFLLTVQYHHTAGGGLLIIGQGTIQTVHGDNPVTGNGKQIRAGIADGNTGLTTVHHWHHGGGQRTVCGIITLQEKNRLPNIIAVLFFLIVCFPEIIQPGHPVFPLQNKDVMFDISERF